MRESRRAASSPSVLDRFWTAVRCRLQVSRYCREVLEAAGHAPTAAPGQLPPRTLVVGNDPVRILLFGEGVTVGYGVGSRAEAIDGALAKRIAELTGRGVILENRARPNVRVDEVVESLGGVGTHTFAVGVWSPALTETLERLTLQGWRSRVTAMLQQIRADSDMPLVIAQLPVPSGTHPSVLILRPWYARLNRTIAEVAARFPDVVTVELGTVVVPMRSGDPVLGTADYRRQADPLAEAVRRALWRSPSASADALSPGR
ncbi:hypothetical protein [Amnibacterium kyonggiense]|uniref:hypothetical protein n=1 Tax=Amnibacterium kyonggiense TaxID=595671 RepID=UPI00105C38EC|nr:hypothetical protein [Amnibacterium kyonggiense]